MMKRESELLVQCFLKKFSLLMVLGALILALSVPVQAGILDGDPMVRITCLPIPGLDVNTVMDKVSDDVCKDMGLDKNLITYYWNTFDAMYCPVSTPAESRIIFVDLYVPNHFTDEQVSNMLKSLAASLEKHTGIAKEWIFIHTHFPKKGQVYISGEVV
jgi:hypothetical protein